MSNAGMGRGREQRDGDKPERTEETMDGLIQHFYIGSYARMGTPGIFSAQLDREAGTLSVMPLCSEVENPSWLTRHANGNVLYVTEDVNFTKFRSN